MPSMNLHSRRKQPQTTDEEVLQQHPSQQQQHVIPTTSATYATTGLIAEDELVNSGSFHRRSTSSIRYDPNNTSSTSAFMDVSLGHCDDNDDESKNKDHLNNNHNVFARMGVKLLNTIKLMYHNYNNNTYNSKHPYSIGRRIVSKNEYRFGMCVSIWFVVIGFLFGYIILHHQHRRVILHIIHDPWHHGRAFVMNNVHYNSNYNMHFPHGGKFHHHYYTGSPKFVTVVLPSVVNPTYRLRRLEAIHATWGPWAKAIFVVHSVSEEFPHGKHLTIDLSKSTSGNIIMPSDPYSYPQTLLLPQSITTSDGLARLYYTVRTIYERVNPDFAFFVNDHTYVIPEHLCTYLDGVDANTIDMYDGHALKSQNGNTTSLFNSGAAGYLLSRSSMKKLIAKWDVKDPTCWIDDNTMEEHEHSWIQGNPGLVNTACLQSMNITATDTRDRGKYHRFHAYPITRLVMGSSGVDDWYVNKHQNISSMNSRYDGFDDSYATLLSGADCCSEDTISFHYLESKECRALYNIRLALLKNPHMSDEILYDHMVKEWPKSHSDIGHYSRGLPSNTNKTMWNDLVQTIRKISHPALEREC